MHNTIHSPQGETPRDSRVPEVGRKLGLFFRNVWYAATDFRRPGTDIELKNVVIDDETRKQLTPRDLVAIDDFYEGAGAEGRPYIIESIDD